MTEDDEPEGNNNKEPSATESSDEPPAIGGSFFREIENNTPFSLPFFCLKTTYAPPTPP